jgi:hypothetical protein
LKEASEKLVSKDRAWEIFGAWADQKPKPEPEPKPEPKSDNTVTLNGQKIDPSKLGPEAQAQLKAAKDDPEASAEQSKTENATLWPEPNADRWEEKSIEDAAKEEAEEQAKWEAAEASKASAAALAQFKSQCVIVFPYLSAADRAEALRYANEVVARLERKAAA